ncbi:amidohydrolase family protein [Gordonia phthalatica]|uniref:Amidohydrolase n=1 Tax=Gordonia phthalatica TaxID=1136941 RepID=A0A0N9NE85_9ACTN|nr:amidohydrolase family protein [Gordonia phthalatica]ALG85449.1 amidohydrolase [Gordonia phthalatica]
MTLIAIEEHWTTQELTARLKALPADRRDDSIAFNEMGDHLQRLEDIGEARIAAMDEQGIDLQILSVAPPATGPLAPSDAVAVSRDLNDLAVAATSTHPDRFRAFATLPMPAPSKAVEELERAAHAGMVGAMLYGRTGETPLDDPRYDDVLGAAAQLSMPIFIHPQIPSPALRSAAYGGFDDDTGLALSTYAWGWHIEAAVAALRLIASGTFDRHPDLQLVLGHWGELLLFWRDRVDSLTRAARLQRSVADVFRENLHITSSGMFSPTLMQHARDVVGPDRLLFSTDYPFQHPTRTQIDVFLAEFEDVDRARFTHENAQRLFRIDQ